MRAAGGQPGCSAVVLQRVAEGLCMDQAVLNSEAVDADSGDSRWESFAWMAADMVPGGCLLIGAGQAELAGL